MVKGNIAITEDGKRVKLGELKKVVSGDYLRVYGNVAIDRIDRKEAHNIRKVIKSLSLERG